MCRYSMTHLDAETIDAWDRYLLSQQRFNKYDDYRISHNLMRGFMGYGFFCSLPGNLMEAVERGANAVKTFVSVRGSGGR